MSDIPGIIESYYSNGYVIVNKNTLKVLGADGAICLGNLIGKFKYFYDNGMLDEDHGFYLTQEEQSKETGLSVYLIQNTIKLLQKNKCVRVVRKGVPARNFYYLKFDKIARISSGQNKGLPRYQRTKYQDTKTLDVYKERISKDKNKNKKRKNKQKEKRQSLSPIHQHINSFLPVNFVRDEDFQNILYEFIEYRRERGPKITKRAGKMLANKLREFPIQVGIKALEQSIANSWQGVFPERIKPTQYSEKESDPEDIIKANLETRSDSFRESFIRDIFSPANKFLSSGYSSSALARNLVNMYSGIRTVRKKSRKSDVEKLPTVFRIIQDYVEWLGDSDWMDTKGPELFNIDSTMFKRFISANRKYWNNRHPLTGKI